MLKRQLEALNMELDGIKDKIDVRIRKTIHSSSDHNSYRFYAYFLLFIFIIPQFYSIFLCLHFTFVPIFLSIFIYIYIYIYFYFCIHIFILFFLSLSFSSLSLSLSFSPPFPFLLSVTLFPIIFISAYFRKLKKPWMQQK